MTEILGVNIVNLILWFGFGLVVGVIIHAIDPGEVKGGILGTTVLGILGAIVGGFLTNMIFGDDLLAISMKGLATAVVGGLILAAASRLLFRDNRKIKS